MNIPDLLKYYMKKNNVSQSELAAQLGVASSAVNTWLNMEMDSKTAYYEICRVFKVNPVPKDAIDDDDDCADKFPDDFQRIGVLDLLYIYSVLLIQHSPDYYKSCLDYCLNKQKKDVLIYADQLNAIKTILDIHKIPSTSHLKELAPKTKDYPSINIKNMRSILTLLGLDYLPMDDDNRKIYRQYYSICQMLSVNPKVVKPDFEEINYIRIKYILICKKEGISPIIDLEDVAYDDPFWGTEYVVTSTSTKRIDRLIRFGHFNELFRILKLPYPSTNQSFPEREQISGFDFGDYCNDDTPFGYPHFITRDIGINYLFRRVSDWSSWIDFFECFKAVQKFYINSGRDIIIDTHIEQLNKGALGIDEPLLLNMEHTDKEGLFIVLEYHERAGDLIPYSRIESVKPSYTFNNEEYEFEFTIQKNNGKEESEKKSEEHVTKWVAGENCDKIMVAMALRDTTIEYDGLDFED